MAIFCTSIWRRYCFQLSSWHKIWQFFILVTWRWKFVKGYFEWQVQISTQNNRLTSIWRRKLWPLAILMLFHLTALRKRSCHDNKVWSTLTILISKSHKIWRKSESFRRKSLTIPEISIKSNQGGWETPTRPCRVNIAVIVSYISLYFNTRSVSRTDGRGTLISQCISRLAHQHNNSVQ